MAIDDVRPQEPQEQDQPSSSMLAHPPTQDNEQAPQEEGQDQGGAHKEHDKEEEASQVIRPAQVGLAEAQQIRVARSPTIY
jgi:hypothetical protein